MTQRYVCIHERDNVLVALQDIYAGERIEMDGILVLTLEFIIHAASGNQEVAAVRKRQEEFIPWKRGISL